MSSMSESQFKTFRADVRSEVRNIGQEIRHEIYQSVVGEARTTAAATARKHITQSLGGDLNKTVHEHVSYVMNQFNHRLLVLESSVTRVMLDKMRMDSIDKECRHPTPKTYNKLNADPVKEWEVNYQYHPAKSIRPERFTFFRGEWRRDSEMIEFARLARERRDRTEKEYAVTKASYHEARDTLNKFTNAGF